MKRDITYTTQLGNEIQMTLYGADKFDAQPCVIYCHGFKGFKDWGFVPYVGKFFAKHGISFLAFNFSHNGIGEDPLNFTEGDKFERNSITLELTELEEVIRLVAHTNFLGADLNHPLGLMGHSRGGGVAILGAAKSTEISAVATWASVSTFDRYDKKTKSLWNKQGFIEVTNSRTGQVFKLGKNMLDDVERHSKKSLNVLQAVRSIAKPYLIVHGQSDETVPFYDAEQLNIYANPLYSTLRLIPGASHTFGAKHPFTKASNELELAVTATFDFFEENLK